MRLTNFIQVVAFAVGARSITIKKLPYFRSRSDHHSDLRQMG